MHQQPVFFQELRLPGTGPQKDAVRQDFKIQTITRREVKQSPDILRQNHPSCLVNADFSLHAIINAKWQRLCQHDSAAHDSRGRIALLRAIPRQAPESLPIPLRIEDSLERNA